jgi:chemotaxis signal transduction protein
MRESWKITGADMSAKVALFSLGSTSFALPVEGIRHILFAPRIFPLPLLRSEFCGVFLYQGEIIPLFNLWQRFGMTICPSANRFTAVMSTEVGLVGLPAGEAPRIICREQGGLKDAANEEQSPGADRTFIHAETEYSLLDVEELIEVLPTKETTPVLSSKGTKEA